MDSSNVYALTVMALTYASSGQVGDAEQIYRRMLDLDQYGESIAYEGLADLAMSRGDDVGALNLLDTAIEIERARGSLHSVALKNAMRAEALLRLGEKEAALRATEDALEFASGDAAVLVPGAKVLVELDRADHADAIAAELGASVSRSDRAYAALIRAHISESEGDLGEAVEQVEAALVVADLWLARMMLAHLNLEMGQQELSAKELDLCRQRLGEGLAVFLNDRPTFRLVDISNTASLQAMESN